MKKFTINAKMRQSEYLVKALNRLVECVADSSADYQDDLEYIIVTCAAREYEKVNKVLGFEYSHDGIYPELHQNWSIDNPLVQDYLEQVADNRTYLAILSFMHWDDAQINYNIERYYLHLGGLVDTAIEFAMQIGQTIYAEDSEYCGGHDKIFRLAEQYDEKWESMSEQQRNESSFTAGIEDECDTFLRQNGYSVSGRFGGNKVPERTEKPTGAQHDIAWVLVQITEDYSKMLIDEFPLDFENMDERSETLYDYAQRIVHSDAWREMPDGPSQVYHDFMEEEIKRLRLQNARFKVGDRVWTIYEDDLKPLYVVKVEADKKDICYYLAENSASTNEDAWAYPKWIWATPSEFLESMKERIYNGEYK